MRVDRLKRSPGFWAAPVSKNFPIAPTIKVALLLLLAVPAIVVAGDTQSNTGGSLDVWYNYDVLENTRDNGALAGAPGSWRDW